MKLPNAERAEIDRRKLADYCLNPGHPRGKRKARVFSRALGVEISDASELEREVRKRVLEESCSGEDADAHGARFNVDFEWKRGA